MPAGWFRTPTLITVALLAGAGVASPQARPPVLASGSLQKELDQWFAKASRSAPGSWGIAIATQDGQLLWGVSPTKPMVPASTVKLFTTGFARSVLGSDARKHTKVVGVGQIDPSSGAWMGSWALELNGDVTLERRTHGGPTLAELAKQRRGSGIRSLAGPLQVVSSAGKAGASYPSAWSSRHKGRVFAPLIGSLTLNENVFSFAVAPGAKAGQKPRLVAESPLGVSDLIEIKARTVAGKRNRLRYQSASGGRYVVSGTIGTRARIRSFTSTTHDPQALLEVSWARALRDAGIEWQRTPGLGAPAGTAEATVLAEVDSEPFDSIASEINRRSLNIGAELLLRWAGGDDDPAARLTAHVQQITGEYAGVKLVDGSGLSHEDRATPLAFVTYLARFPGLPAGRGFPGLLPANGTGTLRHLAKGFPAAGVVRAKTGTLGDVATLAGYLGRPDGVLVISLMYNGPRVYAAKQAQWRLFRLLGAEGVTLPLDSLDISSSLGSEDREPPSVP